ncbi:putative pathogenesis-related protein PRMS-like [Capsicum annuum]|nr:putative pathogenesis-related protein PRMS-like [Capsicum annuum]
MLNLRVSLLLSLFYTSILLTSLSGLIRATVVTLDSIEIYNTHELFGAAPEVYFKCQGDNRTISLPDVKKRYVLYAFKGEESWQAWEEKCSLTGHSCWEMSCLGADLVAMVLPLTELEAKKCKRCGIYEKDSFIKPDDIFDEWEFCASDFASPAGKYIHFKEKEFNATFLCPDCVLLEGASNHTDGPRNKAKGMHWALVLLICVLVTTFVVLGAVMAYKYWQKRKKQQEQARFLKLFEESDDVEDELDIGPLSHVI